MLSTPVGKASVQNVKQLAIVRQRDPAFLVESQDGGCRDRIEMGNSRVTWLIAV
jgi:hypothetical protein